jgi:hypothetical protein
MAKPKIVTVKCEEGVDVSDGFHTFGELYDHRIALWIALCKAWQVCDLDKPWRSRLHSDGTSIDGWFLLGMFHLPGTQITYHLPNPLWDDCSFAETLDRAPEFDGHTAADVLARVRDL